MGIWKQSRLQSSRRRSRSFKAELVPRHGLGDELRARLRLLSASSLDETRAADNRRVLLERALDDDVGPGLVEEGDAVARSLRVARRRHLDPMKVGLEPVVAPAHQLACVEGSAGGSGQDGGRRTRRCCRRSGPRAPRPASTHCLARARQSKHPVEGDEDALMP